MVKDLLCTGIKIQSKEITRTTVFISQLSEFQSYKQKNGFQLIRQGMNYK